LQNNFENKYNSKNITLLKQNKMKKKLLILIALFIWSFTNSYSQSLKWAKSVGGTAYNAGNAMALDADGNVFTTGFFTGTGDFNPGAGTATLTSVGSDDIFISKLDSTGNFVWAIQMGGTALDHALSLAIDASGNIYIIGEFQGTADFNPGTGVANLVSLGGYDIFIAKYDNDGNYMWAKQMGSANIDGGIAIAVDASASVYATGVFRWTTDFNPGAGTANLTTMGGDDAFIAKYDSAGNFRWAKQIGGTSGDFGYAITTDASANVYTTGTFGGTVDFDPSGSTTYTLTSVAGSDAFISKLDSAGNFVWAKQMGGSNIDAGNGITIDASGNIYTTGFFWGSGDFDPGAGTFNLAPIGDKDVFVLKLDATGAFVWAKSFGGTVIDAGSSIAVDGAGNVYTTGGFAGTADFDPLISASHQLSAVWGADVFISKLDASGAFVWAESIGGASDDGGKSIALDSFGNIYIAGTYSGVVDFDNGPGVVNLTAAGAADAFICKMGQAGGAVTAISENELSKSINVFPNPSRGQITININQSAVSCKLINLVGQTLMEKTNLTGNKITLDVADQPNGIYFISIQTAEETFIEKIIISK
jgi:Secretion system C-terminal sorting domain/Beta-propeller repeat